MPTICIFYGIKITMYWDDHAPPHFHVKYAEHKATVGIDPLKVITGELPSNATRLVMEWAQEHQSELLENWTLCRQELTPRKITPLK